MKKQKQSGFTHIEIIIVVIALALIGTLGFVFYKNYIQKDNLAQQANQNSSANKPDNTITHNSSVLVFQSGDSINSKMSIANPDGKVEHEITSNANSSKYSLAGLGFIDGSSFLTNNQSMTDFSILSYDGSSSPINTKVNSYLKDSVVDFYTKRESSHRIDSYVLVNKDTLIASVEEPILYKLISINLATGDISTLITTKAIINNHGFGYEPIHLKEVSADGNIVYLFSEDANINAADIPGNSLISYNISTKKYTTKTIPSNVAITPQNYGNVSKDGEHIAYQNNGDKVVNHIFNVGTGSDITSSDELSLENTPSDFSFSPDSKYLATTGSPSGDILNDLSEIQIVSVINGKVVQTINLPDTSGPDDNIAVAGWMGDHTLVYYSFKITPDINTSGLSNSVHSVDAVTGKIFDYPSSLGSLLTVLNYKK